MRLGYLRCIRDSSWDCDELRDCCARMSLWGGAICETNGRVAWLSICERHIAGYSRSGMFGGASCSILHSSTPSGGS